MARLPCVVSLNNALITKTCECDAVIVSPPGIIYIHIVEKHEHFTGLLCYALYMLANNLPST